MSLFSPFGSLERTCFPPVPFVSLQFTQGLSHLHTSEKWASFLLKKTNFDVDKTFHVGKRTNMASLCSRGCSFSTLSSFLCLFVSFIVVFVHLNVFWGCSFWTFEHSILLNLSQVRFTQDQFNLRTLCENLKFTDFLVIPKIKNSSHFYVWGHSANSSVLQGVPYECRVGVFGERKQTESTTPVVRATLDRPSDMEAIWKSLDEFWVTFRRKKSPWKASGFKEKWVKSQMHDAKVVHGGT